MMHTTTYDYNKALTRSDETVVTMSPRYMYTPHTVVTNDIAKVYTVADTS